MFRSPRVWTLLLCSALVAATGCDDAPAEGKKGDAKKADAKKDDAKKADAKKDDAKKADAEKDDAKQADAAGGAIARSGHPGTKEGAQALLEEFLKPGADLKKLTAQLQPDGDDYKAVFVDAAAATAEEKYRELWTQLKDNPLAPKDGQTELLLSSATTEELAQGTGESGKFPGGYKNIADKLKPGVTWYRFKFVKPGETLGMAFDGLTHVNGHWAIFPKPFRALK